MDAYNPLEAKAGMDMIELRRAYGHRIAFCGNMDVVVCSAYADWDKSNPKVVSLMWFRNDGHMNFAPHILAYTPKDLITLDAADLDGNGRPALITGGLYVYPPYVRMARVTVWRRPPAP